MKRYRLDFQDSLDPSGAELRRNVGENEPNTTRTLGAPRTALSLTGRVKQRTPRVVVHTCNPSTEKVEAGSPRVQGLPELQNQSLS